MKRKVPTALQVARIVALLDAHYDKETQRYRDGYDDLKLASIVGVRRNSIAHIRLTHYGRVNTAKGKLSSRVDELEKQVADLRGTVKTLEDLIVGR